MVTLENVLDSAGLFSSCHMSASKSLMRMSRCSPHLPLTAGYPDGDSIGRGRAGHTRAATAASATPITKPPATSLG